MHQGDGRECFRIVWELEHGEAAEMRDTAAPGAADFPVIQHHLMQTYRAARVPALQKFGPSSRAERVKADLALRSRERLHDKLRLLKLLYKLSVWSAETRRPVYSQRSAWSNLKLGLLIHIWLHLRGKTEIQQVCMKTVSLLIQTKSY